MKDLSACTALVVEDSQVQRDHVAGLLQQVGFGLVLAADNGLDALRALEERGSAVDLVLTDLDMPGMDGVELIQHLAQRRLAANLIAASANHKRLDEATAGLPPGCAMRVLAALPKPVRLDRLAAIMQETELLALDQLVGEPTAVATSAELEAALAARQFVPFYQPRVTLDSGRLAGVVLQPRWRHAGRGLLGADAFLAGAGDCQLAGRILQTLAQQAAAQLRNWQEMGLSAIRLTLPLPPEVLGDLQALGLLLASMQEQGLKPASLCWEVSESVVARGEPDMLHNLNRLSLRGYSIGVGNCGRYDASMRQFACCPLGELTIDSLFVDDVARRSNRRPLLDGLLDIAGQLGLPACGDGISRVDDWALLRDLGCAQGQGSLIGDAMPADDFVAWFKESRQRLRSYAASGVAPTAAGLA